MRKKSVSLTIRGPEGLVSPSPIGISFKKSSFFRTRPKRTKLPTPIRLPAERRCPKPNPEAFVESPFQTSILVTEQCFNPPRSVWSHAKRHAEWLKSTNSRLPPRRRSTISIAPGFANSGLSCANSTTALNQPQALVSITGRRLHRVAHGRPTSLVLQARLGVRHRCLMGAALLQKDGIIVVKR